MSYYDLTPEELKNFENRGIDYDLQACLEYNQQPYKVTDIERILAVWEGENDREDWRWILQLKDGRFVFLRGGCDYTGWDCQSWAGSEFTTTVDEAVLKSFEGDVPITETNSPINAGLGHMFSLLQGTYQDKNQEAFISLAKQIELGKTETWREKTDKDLNV